MMGVKDGGCRVRVASAQITRNYDTEMTACEVVFVIYSVFADDTRRKVSHIHQGSRSLKTANRCALDHFVCTHVLSRDVKGCQEAPPPAVTDRHQ
ncbi:hypothetical protein EVAR_22345_1 [Eumeta japonica]|uniref:Uncharacterized protein n=1 Tax=Eumeta variegata TaxID=151549 RepID=A0A4C1VK69_EUMVA|nr:hypothetical protein EVAR_22345_1 [Eumeta japonica]